MQKKGAFALWLVVGLAAAGVAKDQIVRAVVTGVGSQVIGAPLRVGGLSLGILRQSIRLKDVRLYNPNGFSKSVIVHLPVVNVSYDLKALVKGKLHLIGADIRIDELGIEENKEGLLNVNALKLAQQPRSEAGEPGKKTAQLAMRIDLLNLEVGRIVYRTYTEGAAPSVKVYEIGLKKQYRDIGSAQQLAALILSEPMKAAGIKGAAVYGAALLTGVGIVPVAIGAVLVSKDSAEAQFNSSFDTVWKEALTVLKGAGTVTSEDKSSGQIVAALSGATARLTITSDAGGTKVTASARRMMLPKPEIARGILYQLSRKLK